MKITMRNPDDLRANDKNSRLHSDEQIEQIADSIERLGFNVPILVTEEDELVAGEGRWLASILLGLDEIPTITLAHLTEDEIREFMIIDNKLAENSKWNPKVLEVELTHLAAVGFELKAFSDSELKKLTGIGEDPEEYEEIIVETTHECPKCHFTW